MFDLQRFETDFSCFSPCFKIVFPIYHSFQGFRMFDLQRLLVNINAGYNDNDGILTVLPAKG